MLRSLSRDMASQLRDSEGTVQRTQNRFSSLVAQMKPELDELSVLTGRIDEVVHSFKASGASESFARSVLTLKYGEEGRIPELELRSLSTLLVSNLFGDMEKQGSVLRAATAIEKSYIPTLPRAIREGYNNIVQENVAYADNFYEMMDEMRAERSRFYESKLLPKFMEFVSSLQNLPEFRKFLEDTEFDAQRLERSAFLKLLAEDAGHPGKGHKALFARMREEILKRATEEIDPKLLEQTVEQFKERASKRDGRNHAPQLQWLPVLYPDGAIDYADLALRIRKSGVFPNELKEQYQKLVEHAITEELTRIRVLLSPHMPEQGPLITVDIRPTEDRKRLPGGRVTMPGKQVVLEVKDPVDVTPKTYALLLPKQNTAANQASIASFAKAVADKFAPNDERMITDVTNMITSLVADPYGRGSHKLKLFTAQDGSSLWRYRMDQRPEIERKHPSSEALRVVFYFSKTSPDTVILSGILTHHEFDKKYT